MPDVLALDTGFQTGLALWRDGEHSAWDAPEDEAMDWAREALRSGFGGAVVVERITITQHTIRKGEQVLSSVEQVGYLRHLCREHGLEFSNKQTPAEAKGFSNDDKLRAMGWWTVGTDHARDASRHLLLYLCQHDSDFRSLVARRMSAMEGDGE